MKYRVRDWRQGQGPREVVVGEENCLLRVILETLLQCSVFITALVIVSVASINFVRPRALLLQYVILRTKVLVTAVHAKESSHIFVDKYNS